MIKPSFCSSKIMNISKLTWIQNIFVLWMKSFSYTTIWPLSCTWGIWLPRTVTRGHICWAIQLYNTCADHPNIHQSQKQCQLYEKVRFNSMTLSLSSLTKSQTEAILHPNVLFYYHSKTTYPSPGYYASFWRVHTIHDPDLLQLLSRDEELRDMPVFLMGDVHGMNGWMTP